MTAREGGEDQPTRATLVARFLRQRRELGHDPLVLERLPGPDALALAEGGRTEAAPAPMDRASPGPRPSPHPVAPPDASAVAASRPSPATVPDLPPGAALPSLPSSHDELRELSLGCTRCRLSQGRTQVVFADGNPAARVMVVGEAPGANEDATGLPFVGAAGKLLDLLLASVDLSREASVYICNVIKCRPPGNRNPRTDEIEACSPYLRAQIRAVQPEAILAVGTFAGQLLTGQDAPLGKLRGKVHAYEGTPLVVTYHPAALLRNSGWTRPTWDDLQLLRSVLDAR
jgi:uracil-DNA glycosylase